MEKQMFYYSLTLTEDQVKYLRDKKYKVDRMECFMSLLDLVVRVRTLVQITKTKQIELLPGQFMTDHTQLADLWGKDRKTVPKLLKAMEDLGIFSSQVVEDNRVYSLHSLSGWMENGQLVTNPYGLRRNPEQTAYFHAEVRPARVFPVEVDTTQNADEAASKSEGVTPPVTNVATPSSQGVPASPSSPQSNDSGKVGASGSEVKTSSPPADNKSPQSAPDRNSVGSPLSESGAVANPNVGNQNQRPQPPSQPNNAQRPPVNGNQGNPPGSNGFNSPNGSQNPQR